VSQQLTVSNAHTNIATQLAEGIDYTVRYDRELGPGSVRVNFQATHYLEQSNKLFEDDDLDRLNGSLNTPENIASIGLSYYWNNWRFLYGVDWIDSMESYTYLEVNPATSIRDLDVGAYQEHFMSVRYTSEKWEVTAGVRNLFDEEPPTISQGYAIYPRQGNSPIYSGYDFFGREAFVQVSYSLGGNGLGSLD
jgi:outer membrane receptor protein involved in Fe transport